MNSSKKIILIVLIILIIVCCLCAITAAIGGGIYQFWGKSTAVSTQEEIIPTELEETSISPEMTLEAPINIEEPTTAPKSTNSKGLGVSRAEMLQSLNSGNAFNVGKPFKLQDLEAVMGEHVSLCIQSNCAAFTLLGPAKDLMAVSMVVPTDPNDQTQTLTAITLLMDVASSFAGNNSDIPMQVMNDILKAQSNQKNLDKKFNINGYSFNESYDAKTHNAGLAISRPQ